MCETKTKNKTKIEKAQEEFAKSKEVLNESLSEGKDKLCDFLVHLWEKESNKTPAG